jgi:hypothetical protein
MSDDPHYENEAAHAVSQSHAACLMSDECGPDCQDAASDCLDIARTTSATTAQTATSDRAVYIAAKGCCKYLLN